LLKTVQGKLGLVIDVDLERLWIHIREAVRQVRFETLAGECRQRTYVLHELLAGGSDVLAESSGEHHDLAIQTGCG
jgi:hypothetical protein